MKEEKQETLNRWVNEKGAKWLAERLWQARNDIKKKIDECPYRRYISISDEVDHANNRMAEVLLENGIKPTKLLVEYQDCCCEGPCPMFEEDPLNVDPYDESDGCDGCDKLGKRIHRFSFWSYEVENGELTGITTKLKEMNMDCIKIIMEDSGTVLYEEPKEQEDEKKK